MFHADSVTRQSFKEKMHSLHRPCRPSPSTGKTGAPTLTEKLCLYIIRAVLLRCLKSTTKTRDRSVCPLFLTGSLGATKKIHITRMLYADRRIHWIEQVYLHSLDAVLLEIVPRAAFFCPRTHSGCACWSKSISIKHDLCGRGRFHRPYLQKGH